MFVSLHDQDRPDNRAGRIPRYFSRIRSACDNCSSRPNPHAIRVCLCRYSANASANRSASAFVMMPLEPFGEFVRTMNCNRQSTKIVPQRRCMITIDRRYEIRQAMVKLSRRLLHLLAQEIEGGELL